MASPIPDVVLEAQRFRDGLWQALSVRRRQSDVTVELRGWSQHGTGSGPTIDIEVSFNDFVFGRQHRYELQELPLSMSVERVRSVLEQRVHEKRHLLPFDPRLVPEQIATKDLGWPTSSLSEAVENLFESRFPRYAYELEENRDASGTWVNVEPGWRRDSTEWSLRHDARIQDALADFAADWVRDHENDSVLFHYVELAEVLEVLPTLTRLASATLERLEAREAEREAENRRSLERLERNLGRDVQVTLDGDSNRNGGPHEPSKSLENRHPFEIERGGL